MSMFPSWLVNGDKLIMLLIAIVFYAVGISVAKYFKFFQALRRVDGIDAVGEAIKICAEKGRMAFFQVEGRLQSWYTGYAYGALEMAKMAAKLCGELNVPMKSISGMAEQYIIVTDYLRQGLIASGHPERFNMSDHLFFYGGYSATFSSMGLIKREHPGAFLQLAGPQAESGLPIVQQEVAYREGAFIVSGASWPENTAQCCIASDFVILNEEFPAAGAYLSGDHVQIASICAEDLVKIFLVAFVIIGAVVYVAGYHFV